jgi:hypothetical protein
VFLTEGASARAVILGDLKGTAVGLEGENDSKGGGALDERDLGRGGGGE